MLTQVATHSAVATHPSDAKYRHFIGEGPRQGCRSPVWRLVVTNCVCLADIVLMSVAALAAMHRTPHPPATMPFYLVAAVAGALLVAVMLGRSSSYTVAALRSVARQVRVMLPALVLGAVAQGLILWGLAGSASSPSPWPLWWLMASVALLIGFRIVLAPQIRAGIRAGLLSRRIAVVGATDLGFRIAEHIAIQPGTADQIIGVFDDDNGRPHSAATNARLSGRVADLLALSRRERVDAIVITVSPSRAHRIDELCGQFRCTVADVYFAPDLRTPDLRSDEQGADLIGGRSVVKVIRRPLTEWQILQKTILDRFAAACLLLLFSPVLLMIALAIRLDSRGPILFRQPRVGFNNVPFTVFKFRSMYHNMADLLADRQTSRDDPRVTRVGRPLRKLSLDELPQLLNVLLGEMSLVGPRPHAPNTKAEGYLLDDVAPGYADRHRILPGITGWAQINGARGELRTIQELEIRLQHDMYYIRNWSLFLDIKILWLTVVRELISSRAF